MSFPSDVVQSLSMLWRQTLINRQILTPTVRLPLQVGPLTNYGETLKLDSNALSESNIFDYTHEVLEQEMTLYSTGNGFGYDMQQNSGAFFFLGIPGLFDFGFNRLTVTDSNDNPLDPTQTATALLYFDFHRSLYEPVPTVMRGAQHAQVYLNSNSAVLIVPYFNDSNLVDYYNITPSNELIITRLSTNIS